MLTENNPDAIISVVFATSNNIPADGTSTASVTAQVTDSAGAGLSGQSVVFTATAGAIIGSPVITDTSGLATTTLTSTTAGISSVTASVNGSAGHVDITFTEAALSPVISSLVSDKDSIVNDGNDKAILTVIVSDNRTGNPVAGENITWTTSAGTIEPGTSLSSTDGLAIAALADTGDTGAAIVTASLDNGEEATCGICLENNDAGWIISSLTSDKDSIVNDGTDIATLTATVIDSATGSIVSGAAVSWSTDSGTVTPATSATGENGLTTTQLSDTGDTGTATVTAALSSGEEKTYSVALREPVTLAVRGARRRRGTGRNSLSCLVAIDLLTGQPVTARWQYEGEDSSVTAFRFADPQPEKSLQVFSAAGQQRFVLTPMNVAGFPMDPAGDAFAVVTDAGGAMAWGSSASGGVVPPEIATRTDLTVPECTPNAYAALTSAGGVVTWGNSTNGGNVPSAIATRTDLSMLASTDTAFAALTVAGGGLAWGNSAMGGSVPTAIATRTDLVALSSSASAFAALTRAGGVVAWGNSTNGGSVPSAIATRTDLVTLTGTDFAFAALTAAGGVVAWGSSAKGGAVPTAIATRTDLVELSSNISAFAALTKSGSVVAWGDSGRGGSVPPTIATRTDLVTIAGNRYAFSALTASAGVVAWGNSANGGVVPAAIATRTDLIAMASSDYAFAALTASGGVVAWGNGAYGGTIPADIQPLLTDVVAVYGCDGAFCALKSDSTVVVWGGGNAGKMANIPENLQGNVSYYQE
ncbi:Ig-like domain-containing protein [Kluyvera intermedia]|uniref:Ig-like domain-containing protein n=1 Tax=Kluyvera intermedia TaxID=61648 RepID=UPI0035242945